MAATLSAAADQDAGETFTYAIVDGGGTLIVDGNFEIVHHHGWEPHRLLALR